ncbi:hypothetical protein ACE6H2_007058 [Prunus campanulata]
MKIWYADAAAFLLRWGLAADKCSATNTNADKSVDKVAQPQFPFALSAAVGESVDLKSGAFSHLKPKSSSRLLKDFPSKEWANGLELCENLSVGRGYACPKTMKSHPVPKSRSDGFKASSNVFSLPLLSFAETFEDAALEDSVPDEAIQLYTDACALLEDDDTDQMAFDL